MARRLIEHRRQNCESGSGLQKCQRSPHILFCRIKSKITLYVLYFSTRNSSPPLQLAVLCSLAWSSKLANTHPSQVLVS